MENMDLKYAIKNIYGPVVLLTNAVCTLIFIWFFILSINIPLFPPFNVLIWIYIGFEVMFWIKVLELRKKPAELLLKSQSLKIYDQEIMPQQIDKIIIMGYFFQNVGIKLVNKRGISSLRSFRIYGDGDEVIMNIKEWSERNGVKVERGQFSVWF